ncbi:Bet3 family protein (transporter particle component) [Phlyctema vagabunda]|uniref:Bet3 family protein (Transporter particle component) n=1 Tax=Phlyctema vagabunda TaxID=108571 RepID=A0ABR4PQM1_9HELO
MSFDSPLPPFNASDPLATFFNASTLDLLMIELVPMAYRVHTAMGSSSAAPAGEQTTSHRTTSTGGAGGGGGGAAVSAAGGLGLGLAPTTGGQGQGRNMQNPNLETATATTTVEDEDEDRDAVFFRLEMLGYRVGQGLVERFSKDRGRFTDTLDVIKFLCKDLWMLVFRKQIDNLKTNHRGVYVLTDNSFRPFARMSTEAGGQAVVRAQPFLWFPCGIIRGALASMGIDASVQAETNELPGATFQIKSIGTRA